MSSNIVEEFEVMNVHERLKVAAFLYHATFPKQAARFGHSLSSMSHAKFIN
jgi:hypothetical protein